MTIVPRGLVLSILVGALIALLGACRPVIDPRAAGSAATAVDAVAAPDAATEATETAALSDSDQLLVDAAAEQVAQATNVAVGDVHLTSLEAVEWSDASVGCPQPDMMYAQVITPGYLLVFDAAGQTVEVHTDAVEPPQIVICQP